MTVGMKLIGEWNPIFVVQGTVTYEPDDGFGRVFCEDLERGGRVSVVGCVEGLSVDCGRVG